METAMNKCAVAAKTGQPLENEKTRFIERVF